MKERGLKRLAGILSALLLFFSVGISCLALPEGYPRGELVVVLDASGSMKQNDPERLAVDAINQIICSMLTNVDVGFVAFGDEVTKVVPLAAHGGRERVVQQVSDVQYVGYTNAGDALQAAVGLFSNEQGVSRYIAVLSDGEIAMKTPEETAQSVLRYQGAIREAKGKGISIFTIGLEDELADVNNSIFDAATQSGGKTYFAPTAEELQNTINTILWEDLGLRKQSVASVTATGGEDHITVQLPGMGADTVRILLTGREPVGDLGVNCTAQDMRVYTGGRYGIVELKKPAAQDIDVRFSGSAGDRVSAELVAEYYGVPRARADYEDTELEDRIQRTATISVTLQNADNEAENLLADAFFTGKDALLFINGTEESVKIADGTARLTREVTGPQELQIDLSLPYLDINLFTPGTAEVSLHSPPPLPPKPNYTPLWITLGALALVILLLLLWYRSKRIKMQRPKPEPEPPPSIYDFAGKLNIYITHAPDGSDIAPQTFTLYRLFTKKEISLAAVLEQCGLRQEFRGAATILFQPGANHSLIITNKSDCTLLKGRELIMKQHSYPIYFEDKVSVTFEDESSELTMIYKNVKPSER